MNETKICSDCESELPLVDFYAGSGRFNRQGYCKECAPARVRKFREMKTANGLTHSASVKEANGIATSREYIKRHKERREREAKIAAELRTQEQEEPAFPKESGFRNSISKFLRLPNHVGRNGLVRL